MAKGGSTKDQRMRQRLTLEAARILAEEGVKDYYLAKRKAADRLGAPSTQNMPRNQEIQDALIEYQRLFKGDEQQAHLRHLRVTALEAMRFFRTFRPKLVGPVLDGSAGEWSEVLLHLFADTAEEVAIFLMDEGIPFEPSERRLRMDRDVWEFFPVYRFVAGDVTVDLTVFTHAGRRQPPRSQVDGQPMERAGLSVVERLLEPSEPLTGFS
ncbi:hypothetical protein J2T57_004056 [Natronocella acetinitrilica]|uniref:Uncharacterized protein n=1 Tax=Natronocella acetinitrilica TaxID=414046 RepID=A0AAE3G8B9_9GAMM|nr:hypothetical protein [Natronocella acetinitrilica]MCP1676883.1 hypothetical protein [Natronocella acetinitrilica]